MTWWGTYFFLNEIWSGTNNKHSCLDFVRGVWTLFFSKIFLFCLVRLNFCDRVTLAEGFIGPAARFLWYPRFILNSESLWLGLAIGANPAWTQPRNFGLGLTHFFFFRLVLGLHYDPFNKWVEFRDISPFLTVDPPTQTHPPNLINSMGESHYKVIIPTWKDAICN